MNFPTGCFFPLCQLQRDCHSVYFPDIIWSNCGCCSAFLRCSLTSPPTPLPVLCHTGITVSTLASTPHLSKPSGKYSPPWITHYIAKVQSQRHLAKICFGFLSEQWALLLMHCLYWAENVHSAFQANSQQWPYLKELAVWALKEAWSLYIWKSEQALAHTSVASNTANITANTSVYPWEQEVKENITSSYRLASQLLK